MLNAALPTSQVFVGWPTQRITAANTTYNTEVRMAEIAQGTSNAAQHQQTAIRLLTPDGKKLKEKKKKTAARCAHLHCT